jgi:hypothetical protein
MKAFLREFFSHDEVGVSLLNYTIDIRSPITINWNQIRSITGITSPKRRRRIKAKLGRWGWILPYREGIIAPDGKGFEWVSVRNEAVADYLRDLYNKA